jgi:hypothetical protein
MKNYINTITEGDCLLNTLGEGAIISESVEVTPDIITAYDDDDIVTLDIAGFEDVSQLYFYKRQSEYPPITDYLDGIVKGDTAQVDKYVADCLAIKAKYPKV